MSITGADSYVASLTGVRKTIEISKGSLTTAAGNMYSTWTVAGNPGAGAAPTTQTTVTRSIAGTFGFSNASSGSNHLTSIFSYGDVTSNVFLLDRLAHCGGLSGTNTSAQTTDVTVVGLPADRLGDAEYRDIVWFLEWYTATGSTAVNATVNVTHFDATTASTSVSLSGTRPVGYIVPIFSSKAIRSVESVDLNISTGTAGNFGVTAGRFICDIPMGSDTDPEGIFSGVDITGLAKLHNDTSLWIISRATDGFFDASTYIFSAVEG